MSGNAKHQAAVERATEAIAQLRTELRAQLAAVVDLAEQLADLVDTRQSVGLGFQTPEGKELANKQAAADRAAARGLTGRIDTLGQGWMNTTTVLGTGQVPAPVTMPAVSVSAEILFTLRHHVDRLGRRAIAAGLCLLPRLPENADVDVLAGRLIRLVDMLNDRRELQALARDLTHLEAQASDIVNGPAKTNHPGPCPWCGQHSLVIHHREKGRDSAFIRCAGTHPCRCEHTFCDCQTNPIRHRHEWINSGRAAHNWHTLVRLQRNYQETLDMETKALDAIERVRQLHRPEYDDGEPAYTFVVTNVPADHECTDQCIAQAEVDGADATLHAVLCCAACGDPLQADWPQEYPGDGSVVGLPVFWPCPTARALELDQPTNPTEENR